MTTVRRDARLRSPRRRPLAVATALLGIGAVAGCGGGTDPTTVSGSCAQDKTRYAAVSPLSAADLEALLGRGRYRVEGNVRPGAGGVPDAGQCSYARADHPDQLLLQVGVNRQTDLFASYDESRALQKSPDATPIEGVDGYTVPDPGSGPGSGDHGPLAVVFGSGQQTVTVHVVDGTTPVKGTQLRDRLASTAKRAATYLGKPMR